MTTTNAALYRSFFTAALREARDAHARYDAEVEAWYTTGEGQSPNWQTEVDEDGNAHHFNMGGKGYTFPRCIHGTSRWTDYDNICGGCEDGQTDIQEAQGIARSRFRKWNERIAFIGSLPADLPSDLRSQVITWAVGDFE